ncbi:hypothetical protein [Nonomuraea jabiensis]|uniref:Uncharacterized protein n=1 Tax=Nonomuraea jabiensis TaxID=882448 RepID=A0A7W9LBI1_9ACTN|nr:hypothetical protein [Nonomuraea jabiensis]MBB5777538.1 hypothetical protein [Nonomuraea jabiensis]
MRSAILGGLAASFLLAATAPAVAAAPAKPLTPDQLSEALLTPSDLGEEYTENEKRYREALDSEAAHTPKCRSAIKALKPLVRSKAAAFIDEEGKPSGVKQFLISGTPAQLTRWESAGKVMVRDCAGVKANSGSSKAGTTKLSIGKFGSWTYGIRHRKTIPALNSKPSFAADVVLIGAGNSVMLLVSDGFFGTFDPGLSKRAAKVAMRKLKDAQAAAAE